MYEFQGEAAITDTPTKSPVRGIFVDPKIAYNAFVDAALNKGDPIITIDDQKFRAGQWAIKMEEAPKGDQWAIANELIAFAGPCEARAILDLPEPYNEEFLASLTAPRTQNVPSPSP